MSNLTHPSIRNRRSRLSVVIVGITMLLTCVAISAQERTTLRKVEILGLQRRPADEVIATSGLKVGDLIDPSMIDAAAARLMRSGWFQSVDYRVRVVDGDSTVIFEVVEKAAAINPTTGETLGQVAWRGNTALSSEDLSVAFGLRVGDLVSQTKIDEGLGRVRNAYSRRGYINAQITDVTRNRDNRRTDFQFTIREGQQYRMGLLSITGLGPVEAGQLKRGWTLARGAVFDESYLDRFRTTVVHPFVISQTHRTGIRSRFEVNIKPDTQKHTVDVIIIFK